MQMLSCCNELVRKQDRNEEKILKALGKAEFNFLLFSMQKNCQKKPQVKPRSMQSCSPGGRSLWKQSLRPHSPVDKKGLRLYSKCCLLWSFAVHKKVSYSFFPCEKQGSNPLTRWVPFTGCPRPSLKGVQDQRKQQLELQVYSLSPGDKMPREPSGAFNMTRI